jgi:hypothetical protein
MNAVRTVGHVLRRILQVLVSLFLGSAAADGVVHVFRPVAGWASLALIIGLWLTMPLVAIAVYNLFDDWQLIAGRRRRRFR